MFCLQGCFFFLHSGVVAIGFVFVVGVVVVVVVVVLFCFFVFCFLLLLFLPEGWMKKSILYLFLYPR